MLLNGKYQCMSHSVCLAHKAYQNIVNQHTKYEYFVCMGFIILLYQADNNSADVWVAQCSPL